ncbi:MAG: lyase [Alphaproteobacteria bacterium]|nr:lyase [Alphaproteobacteria bacterium]
MALRVLVLTLLAVLATGPVNAQVRSESFALPSGAAPHDVAVGRDGIVWYTAQRQGALGRFDPRTRDVKQISLGQGSSPHGVIIGPDEAPWITDSGLNAIVRVDPSTFEVRRFPLPISDYANLNTATFDANGVLWFTGQSGYYGKTDPKSGDVKVWKSERGRGPYGIATTPDGQVFYASLAGSHIARIDVVTGATTIVEPPTRNQGARRVWSDSQSRVWVSEWNSGQVSVYDTKAQTWRFWKLPGQSPRTYAVYVDPDDMVWLSEWDANAMVRFDPRAETFASFPNARRSANVRQMLGRPGEVWLPESGTDHLTVLRTR